MSVDTSDVISYIRHGFTDTADTRLTGFYLLAIFLSPIPISLQDDQFYRHAQYVRWNLWMQAFRLVKKVLWSLSDFYQSIFMGSWFCVFSWYVLGYYCNQRMQKSLYLCNQNTLKKISEIHRLKYSKTLNKNIKLNHKSIKMCSNFHFNISQSKVKTVS